MPRAFEETMMQVADRLDGKSGVETVIMTLPSRISDAMLTMMENIKTINNKVRTLFVPICNSLNRKIKQ